MRALRRSAFSTETGAPGVRNSRVNTEFNSKVYKPKDIGGKIVTQLGNRKKIVSYSRVLKYLLLIAMVVLPVIIIGKWVIIDKIPAEELCKLAGVREFTVGLNTQFYGALVSIIPALIAFLLTFNGFKLFALYEKGKILTIANVACFRNIGYLFICQGVASFVLTPVYTIIMTMNNGPGKHSLSVGLSSNDILPVVGGFFIIVVAWVMDEAKKINEEVELTI